jgi:hypothetical protein
VANVPAQDPVAESAAAQVPGLEIPRAEVSAAQGPGVEIPAAGNPAAEAPATAVSAAESAGAQASAAPVRVVEIPVAKALAADVPVTNAPTAGAPVAKVAAAQVPEAQAPAAQVPAAKAVAAEVPVTKGPPWDIRMADTPAEQEPRELVGVGGAARGGLSQRAGGQAAVQTRPASAPTDTLPDWRPEPGVLRPPTAGDADPGQAETRGLDRLLNVRGWPLAIVLVVQAALSLRLIWSATAYIDEGLYLSVGHLELDHFLHHAAMPNVASFMSGSPVVYPPLAALADGIGGLAGARLLSLIFMLIATVMLHGVTRRLMASRPAAFFAAALFGWLGTAQFLGAFATYDAMALMLLTLATWLGVRAIELDYALRYTLLCAAGLGLALADAAKYAAALFNPVVLAVVALAVWRADGRKAGLDALGAMVLATILPLTVGYDLAGASYGQGISATTLSRANGTASVRAILDLSAHATGLIAVLAVLGAVLITARRPGWTTVALAWTLAAAEFLAPAEQARIHTLTSLFKHVGYGAWFACIVGGYLLAELPALLARAGRLVRPGRSRAGRAGPGRVGAGPRPRWALLAGAVVGTAVAVAAGAFGVTVANAQHDTWPDSRPMIADLTRLVRPDGTYLVEDPNVVTYYLRTKVPFENIDDTYVFDYPDPQTHRMLVNVQAYAAAIQRGYFAGIVLAFGDTFATDQLVVADINRYHTYRLAAVVPYRDSYGPSQYKIWIRVTPRPAAGHPRRSGHRHRRRGSRAGQVRTHT